MVLIFSMNTLVKGEEEGKVILWHGVTAIPHVKMFSEGLTKKQNIFK